MKIIIIVPYFGKTPGWIDYFIKSCSYNPEINWLLFSDIIIKSWLPKNVHLEKADIEDFNKLATSKLNLPINIINLYKLCDFKPAFGHIFYDYIRDFDFWGYCDLDLIFGKISNFIKEFHFKNFDIITTRKEYMAGHFTLYKNNFNTNQLYMNIWNIKKILRDNNRHYCIDEKSNYIGYKFLNKNSGNFKIIPNTIQRAINSIRYRSLKILPLKYDISRVLEKEEKLGNIKILRLYCIYSDLMYNRQNNSNWLIEWNNGILFDSNAYQELMYFHFILNKNKRKFKITPYSNQSKFKIRIDGIYS